MMSSYAFRSATTDISDSTFDPFAAPGLPDGHPFLNIALGQYWSASTDNIMTTSAFCYNTSNNAISSGDKTLTFHYWCVHGGGRLMTLIDRLPTG